MKSIKEKKEIFKLYENVIRKLKGKYLKCKNDLILDPEFVFIPTGEIYDINTPRMKGYKYNTITKEFSEKTWEYISCYELLVSENWKIVKI